MRETPLLVLRRGCSGLCDGRGGLLQSPFIIIAKRKDAASFLAMPIACGFQSFLTTRRALTFFLIKR